MGSVYSKMIQSTAVRYADEIRKYCKELSRSFNLCHFWYYRLTHDGHIASLGTHLGWMEYFASEEFYLKYPYVRQPKYLKDSIVLHKDSQEEALKEIYSSCREKFGMQQSLQILQKTPEGIEEFGFSSKSSSDVQTSIFINEIPLLRLFIKQFRKDNQRILRKIEDDQVNIAEMMGADFYNRKTLVDSQFPEKGALLERMGIRSGVSLNPVEVDTMKLLLDGYSASQIAGRLHRSKRTIEHRIERMKNKLECESKVELIQKAQIFMQLESLGSIL